MDMERSPGSSRRNTAAHTHCHRCLASASQRSRAHPVDAVASELEEMGHEVHVIEPGTVSHFPLPDLSRDPTCGLAVQQSPRDHRRFRANTAIHIATEGPLGIAVRRYCVKRGLAFTTSFHTRFPEYIHARTRMPLSWTYGIIALVPWTGGDHDGGHAIAANRNGNRGVANRLDQDLVARRRSWSADSIRARDKSMSCPSSGRSGFMSAASPSRKTSRPFSISSLRAPKCWSGDGPQVGAIERGLSGGVDLSAPSSATNSPSIMRRAMFSFSRARPTRSAWW